MFLVRWIGILLSRKLQNVMEAVENTEKESIGLGAAPCSLADVSRSHFLRPSFSISFHPSPSLSRALFVSVLIVMCCSVLHSWSSIFLHRDANIVGLNGGEGDWWARSAHPTHNSLSPPNPDIFLSRW
jgi:hypothetical protein